jgi:hypothetical protein
VSGAAGHVRHDACRLQGRKGLQQQNDNILLFRPFENFKDFLNICILFKHL